MGRCAVETWAEFGFSGTSCTPKVQLGVGTDVFICTGSGEVYIFSAKERKLTAVLQFPGPVSDLVGSHDKQVLYAACMSGVYCVSSQFLLSRAQSSLADAASSPFELKISSEFLLVPEEGVLSLLHLGSVLLTLSQRDTSWILTLYNCPKQSSSSSCESLTSFSLPLVSSVVQDDDERETRVRRRPVLICVCSSDATPLPSSSTSSSEATLPDGHIRLEPVLFKLLFGVDAALAKSPVILCGLPDGCLCFLPLRLPGSRLRVLHNLEQPVVFVGASAVMETGLRHAQCLVAVGELGRVVLIKTDKGGPEGRGSRANFTERCVPGPVVCGCVDKTCLYYSTGSDLLRLDLSGGSLGQEGQESNEETSSTTVAARQTPTSLNVCRVIALAEPTHNHAGEVELLGLSVRGQIQRITLPVEKEDTGLSKMPSTQVGRSARDLLSAIGDVCERAMVLKTAIKSKNQILRHLNQVLNISFLLVAGTNSEENLIRCHATTKWSRLLQKDSLNLTCVLDNSSPYVLEHGWTLSVTVFPLSYPPSAGGESPSTNFSFPFHSLPAGESLEVSLPLAAAGDASFPVTVSCSLIFSLSSLLGEEAANLNGSQHSCISLPLNTLTVDWLHALQVSSPIDAQKKATSQCNNTATDTIQAFLNSRQIKCSRRGEGGGENASKPEREQYSASVQVLSELVRDMLVVKSSGEDPQGPKLAPQNVCVSLLEWLLSEGSGGVRTGHQGDKMSRSVIHARGPNGHTVKLTAKEVNVEEQSAGKEDSLTTVEVQVESSSIAAVCGLHHAVLGRVQTLLQRVPERAASTKSIRSLGLRQALKRAEHLLQQIQQSRVSGAFGAGASTGQMTRSLLSVYRELRENPLLII
ncbi:Fanconi anemia core complex-associated protein 100 isoform X2 [Acanthopagrus latus]|uniref:Fanconi anemia core complex-associated protein 100 isoform X2 n=1 Tax=Acanthopagrus latus TaxID=8177 RepID=UPI00187CC69C|nr:Fanconi anemia core complex-associated protein 100 isoform X2 [Acanthopagrus latus]